MFDQRSHGNDPGWSGCSDLRKYPNRLHGNVKKQFGPCPYGIHRSNFGAKKGVERWEKFKRGETFPWDAFNYPDKLDIMKRGKSE